MQISNQTIEVLKNFAMINPSIAFQSGNILQTVATNKTIMAKAELAEVAARLQTLRKMRKK